MRVKNSLEEAICILLILAVAKGHQPVKSYAISEQLDVSDSYLKKILRKLVLSGLVTSTVSKGGGFSLAKSIQDIYMIDVYYAIEGKAPVIHLNGLADHVFRSSEKSKVVNDNLIQMLSDSQQVFLEQLAGYSIEDLLKKKE
ncbi:MAG TPA: Rrf2 family transcriptional regulator [Candidatus Tetragenococcus pullicola]|nr:Rrf2 family transcriptional regulator [Candidatus Tetragenococcus pullicola]